MKWVVRSGMLAVALLAIGSFACSSAPVAQCSASGDGAASSGGGAANLGGAPNEAGAAGTSAVPLNVLVFNYTTGFGHQSRETAIPLLEAAARSNGIHLELEYALRAVKAEGPSDQSNIARDPCAAPVNTSAFVPGGLDGYDVVFFLNTTGTPLAADGAQQELVHQKALQDFMASKRGGFVGVHSATDTYANWPWYVDMIGASFAAHSMNGTRGTVTAAAGVVHPILTRSGLPLPWSRSDEWYAFDRDVSTLADFTVLLDVEDAFYGRRPTAWVHELPGGGRAFYTSMGHGVEAFQEPAMMQLLMSGLLWAGHRL